MRDFKKELQKKWDKGHKEHNRPWDLKHIDAIGEAQDELLDLYNYCKLMNNKTGDEIAEWSRLYWRKLEIDKRQDTQTVVQY
jgi:hypothetical protein